jgi:hypothetical protein
MARGGGQGEAAYRRAACAEAYIMRAEPYRARRRRAARGLTGVASGRCKYGSLSPEGLCAAVAGAGWLHDACLIEASEKPYDTTMHYGR